MATAGKTKTKRCSKCKESKPLTEFNKSRGSSDGLHNYCRKCCRVHEREWRAKHGNTPEYRARCSANERKRRYGIDNYDELLEKQAGVCAICGNTETATLRGKVKRLAVDHDHATGKIRGLLCNNCNNMLGRSQDNPDTLRKAANYLEQA